LNTSSTPDINVDHWVKLRANKALCTIMSNLTDYNSWRVEYRR